MYICIRVYACDFRFMIYEFDEFIGFYLSFFGNAPSYWSSKPTNRGRDDRWGEDGNGRTL